jgi:class 3 adenylate cyclase
MGAMLPTPGDGDRPAVRISDADRERVVETLRRHTAEGRLTLDEFAERVGTVFDARTERELEVVLSDLPADQVATPATPAEQESRRRRAVRWTVGIMGAGDQKGRWRVEGETNAIAFMGGVCLDLRQAEIEGPEVEIRAYAFMGGIDVIVPDGVEVMMSGFAFMGGRDNRVRGNPLPGTPLVRVRAFAFMGGVTVRTRKPRAERKAERDQERARRRDAIDQGVQDRVAHELARAQRHVDRELAKVDRHLRRGGRYANPGIPPPVPPTPPMPGLWPLPGDHEDDEESIDDLVEGTEERLESQAAPDGTVTILITDIEGSSRMAEALGDNRWIEVLRRHNEILRRCVVNHGGTVVKSQGDGFMVAFQSARRAVLCAISIQRAMEDYRKAHPEEDLRLRIGLHTGEVIREADDVFGRNVIMAARIAGEAQGDEILVSSLVKELTDSGGDLGFDGEREVPLKGITRPCRVYTVEW